jgi:parvulin-like peptidyl-prolyl isomerase
MSGARRSGLVIFGVLLIVLFGGIAVAQGIGGPSVPSGDIALVEDVPGDAGNISQEQYDRAFAQTWKRGGLQEAPEPGNQQFQQINEAAINDNLDQAWLTGEAAELGVTATNREIDTEFQTIRQDQFPSEQAFQQFLKDSDFTLAEVRDRVELQVLSRKIEEQITGDVTEVPQDLIEQTYEDSKESFTTPETRDISLIVTDNAADAKKVEEALAKNSDEKEFARLAREFSTHGSSSQGGETVATEGAFPDPAGADIMSAPEGELGGPVKVDGDTYFFKVNKINPEETQSLEDVRPQLEQQLLPTLQQQAMTDFVESYNSKWSARTTCAEGFIVERCDNYVGDGRLESADPACYEDGETDPAQPLACPAPVPLRAPQAPGGSGEAGASALGLGAAAPSLPQGPVPPGDAAAAGTGAGAPGGANPIQIPGQ